MKHFVAANFESMERFYRSNLINCISGSKPATLVGTASQTGATNLAMFSNIIHLGAQPALIGLLQRPVGVSGDTYRNIIATEVFTINHVHSAMVSDAHATSAKYEAHVSEFDTCNFTPQFIQDFAAPFVHESNIKIGAKLVDIIPIAHNDTTLVIGSIEHIMVSEKNILDDGNLILDESNAMAAIGLEQYYALSAFAKLPYAKAKK